MKKITFDNLPAGSIILAKHYSLWQRFKAWLKGKELPYNDAWIDPFGGSIFSFKDSFWKRWYVFTFTPIKKYNKAEGIKMFKLVLSDMSLDPVEILLKINLVRPNTLKGITLEEMFDNNKYYVKNKVK